MSLLLISFQTSTSGFSVCSSSKGIKEEKATPTAAELFGECSFTDSVSRTQDTVQKDACSVQRDEANETNAIDKEFPSIKNDADATNTQQVCLGLHGSRLRRVRLLRAPGYNELISLHQNH